MFGFIYLIYNLVGGAISGTKGWIENEYAKERGYQRQINGTNDVGLYTDRKGSTRLLSTNELAKIEYDYLTGDAWLCTGAPSTRKRNLSKEWRDNYYTHIKENPIKGKTVVNDVYIRDHITSNDVKSMDIRWNNKYYAYGQWYKDIDSGKLYVIRTINAYKFYMDISTGKLVRITDEEKKYLLANDLYDSDIIKKIIDDFNAYRSVPRTNSSIDWCVFYKNKCIALGSEYDEYEMMGQARPKQLLY